MLINIKCAFVACIVSFVFSCTSNAQTTYTLDASCDTDDECSWNDGSSWVGGIAPLGGTPSSGDIIVIPAGTWVELVGPGSTSQIADGSDVTVQIFGTLAFDGNARLELLDANSVIQFASGAVIDVSDATGESARMQIGTTDIKTSDIGDLDVPNQLTEDNIDGGGCAVTMDCDEDPLPVELLFFETRVVSKQVILNWATASEENFEYFSVQRSKDLIQFEEIGTINGHGDSKIRQDYQFEDAKPYKGTSYYRLQSIDFDGYTEIFNAVSVFVEESNNFEVYPSVLRGSTLNIRHQSVDNHNLSLRVLDLSGRKKYESVLEFGGSIEIPSGLENGIYFVELIDQNIINRTRLIIYR